MKALLGRSLWHRLYSTESDPQYSQDLYAMSSIKEFTKGDFLIYIAVSLVGIVMAGVMSRGIYLLSMMLMN